MAQRPNTPYDPNRLRDPTTDTDLSANQMRSPTDLDNEARPDLPPSEGPSSNTSIALIAVGIAIVLGIAFYGLNSSSLHRASTAPGQATSQNSASTAPGSKNQPSATTGAAPVRPQTNSPASTQPGVNTNSASPGNATGDK